jgi:hypothetical protein
MQFLICDWLVGLDGLKVEMQERFLPQVDGMDMYRS